MDSLVRTCRDLAGLLCWRAIWDANTDLWIYFGTPYVKVFFEPPPESQKPRKVRLRSDWTLWLRAATWRLEIRAMGEEIAARNRDSARRKQMAAARLEGERFTSIAIDRAKCATVVSFDRGATLDIWADCGEQDSEDERGIWTLYSEKNALGVSLFWPGHIVVEHVEEGKQRRTKRWKESLEPIDTTGLHVK